MFGMMLVGRLLGRLDARWPILAGMAMTAASLYFMTGFGVEVSRWDVVWIGALQGLGLGLVFVPIASVAYATLPAIQRTEAASLFSLVRNIGSSIGISVVMTLLARNAQVSHAEIGGRIAAFGAERALLPGGWDPATQSGIAAVNAVVSRQATVIAYVNDFQLLMLLTVLALPLVYFLRSRQGLGPAEPLAAIDH
jgi:DHA2 family multidrug resistance protein